MRQDDTSSRVGSPIQTLRRAVCRARQAAPKPRPARIAVIGTFGNFNLGDDSLLAAFVQWTRANSPETEVIALAPRPDRVTSLFGIDALDHEGRRTQAGGTLGNSNATDDQETPSSPASNPALLVLKSTLRASLPRLWRTLSAARRLVATGLQAVVAFPLRLRVARSIDGFVVLGGGQIFDHWGGPTGHPLTVFLWTLACRIASVPVVVLSLGGKPLHHRASAWLWRRALATAHYVSFRDPDTIDLMHSYGYPAKATQVPDLAFGLHVPRLPPARRVPRVVGVSPMAFRRPGIDPEASSPHYWSYIGTLATLCERLHEAGYEVLMFPSQTRSDTIALDDLLSRLRPTTRQAIGVREVTGLDDLLACIAQTDAMIATRFHGVVLSLVSGRPVVSISYQPRKNDRLLEPFGLARFALSTRRAGGRRSVAHSLSDARVGWSRAGCHRRDTA